MARVKIEQVVGHLSTELRKALAQAVEEAIPDAEFDEHELFRAFQRAVGRRCSTWERVPDGDVDAT